MWCRSRHDGEFEEPSVGIRHDIIDGKAKG